MTQKIGSLMGRTKSVLINRPSNELVCPDSDIGLEFEYENVRSNSAAMTALYFNAKPDNSLHDAGVEFVFKQPMFGQDAVVAVRDMCAHAIGQSYKASQRCGIHVHLDVRDLERSQFIGLLSYYALLEPLIYEWVGDNREANNFCLPFYKAQGSLDQAIKVTKALFGDGPATPIFAQQASQAYSKYAGLNLKCMAEFGSMEFRHLKTTLDSSRVLAWINLIFCLKRAALNVPASTTAGILDAISDPNAAAYMIDGIFGPVLGAQLRAYPGWRDDLYGLGLPNALQILQTTDGLLVPRTPVHAGDIYDPWGEAPDPAPSGRMKTHVAIRGWEKSKFPKEEGQPESDSPEAVVQQVDRLMGYAMPEELQEPQWTPERWATLAQAEPPIPPMTQEMYRMLYGAGNIQAPPPAPEPAPDQIRRTIRYTRRT